MARTVNRVDLVGGQSFKVSLYGLNVNTLLNVYYDNIKVPASDLEPLNGKAGDPLSTNDNGVAEFIFYLRNPYGGSFINNPEATFINFLSLDASLKTFIVVDKASVDTDTIPENYRVQARCYAELEIEKTYEVKFNEIKDWGSTTAAGSTTTRIFAGNSSKLS